MRRRSFIPTTANGNATNISDSKWVKLESDDGKLASLGPSNDDIPLDEIAHATFAKNEGYWMLFEDPEGYDWDVGRPLREQWPWCYPNPSARALEAVAEFRAQMPVVGEPVLTDDEAATIIAQSSDSYAPYFGVDTAPALAEQSSEETKSVWLDRPDRFASVDTANHEPWHTTEETQESDDSDTKLCDADGAA